MHRKAIAAKFMSDCSIVLPSERVNILEKENILFFSSENSFKIYFAQYFSYSNASNREEKNIGKIFFTLNIMKHNYNNYLCLELNHNLRINDFSYYYALENSNLI